MSNIYKVKIYNKTWGTGSGGTLVSVLDEVSNVSIRREVSKLAHAEFEVPRTNSKLGDITIGKKVRIERIDNDNLEYEGLVVGPLDKDQNPVKVNTINRGFLFGQVLTPWNFEFENTYYDDIINNELPYEYKFFRQVSGDDFASGTFINTATINVASGITPSDEDVWIGLQKAIHTQATLTGIWNKPWGVHVSGNTAYMTGYTSNSFSAIDISSPSSPATIDSVSSSASLYGAIGIALSGDFAYVTGNIGNSIAAISIASPATLKITNATISNNRLNLPFGIAISGNYAFVASSAGDSFTSIDISNPATPDVNAGHAKVSAASLNGASNVAISGNFAYVTANNSKAVTTIDISDPTHLLGALTNSVQSGTCLDGAWEIEIKDNYAYVTAENSDSITSLNLSSPATPVIQDYLISSASLDGARGLAVSGDYAYIATFRGDMLTIANIGSPSNLSIYASATGALTDPYSIDTQGDYAYVTTGGIDDYLAIIDTIGKFYCTNGTYISQPIDLGDELSNSTTNGLARVRFQATKGQTGNIDVRLRHKKTGGSWDNWSTSQTLEFEDEMKHLGLTTFSVPATHQHVQTAWELSANTAYSQATSFTPVVQAFELVGQYEQQDFSIGSIDTETEGERITANFEGHLRIFNDIVDSWDKQWEITNNGTIITQATIGSNLASSVMLIEEENCNVDGYRSSDKDMANVVWGLGHGEGLNRLYYEASNSTNSNTYGARKTRKRFPVFAQSTLNTKTSSYLNEYTDPTYEIPVDVIEIPSTHVEAGDVVRFKSNRFDVDANYQIMTEHRYEDNTGERLHLELANQVQNYTGEQLDTQGEMQSQIKASTKKQQSGMIAPGVIGATDTSWHESSINVGWRGESGNVSIRSVWLASTDTFSVAGNIAEAEIARFTDNGMIIRYRRVNTGSDNIRLNIDYDIWSTTL